MRMFRAALLIVAETRKRSQCPLVGEMDTETGARPDSGILVSTKKKGPLGREENWGTLKCVLLSERSSSENLAV